MDEIELTGYDPRWPAEFQAEEARIRAVLSPRLILEVEHFGSTAIPGLAAKPIIDILVAVSSLAAARQQAIVPLEAIGYAYWRDNPKVDRLFLVKGLPPKAESELPVEIDAAIGPRAVFGEENGIIRPQLVPRGRKSGRGRTHHIHMTEKTGELWERLLFRDYLRLHPEEAHAYERLKFILAAKYRDDREAYTEGKADYIRGVMEKAIAERIG
jgi:GrpB-like predicted nucleotidyltransferase (UPF0157 family)